MAKIIIYTGEGLDSDDFQFPYVLHRREYNYPELKPDTSGSGYDGIYHASTQSAVGRNIITTFVADPEDTIIYTQSEHIVNGIRLEALKNKIHGEIEIRFRDADNEEHISTISDYAQIVPFHVNMFDQAIQDIMEIVNVRKQQEKENKTEQA